MSIIVAGFWDLGWNTPIKEIELWEFPLRDFGVTELCMTPISGISSSFVKEYSDLSEILSLYKDHQAIFCDERATTSLSGFKHPENALYIFGRANLSPFLGFKRDGDLDLKIETPAQGGMLWGHQAASIILYDRTQKLLK